MNDHETQNQVDRRAAPVEVEVGFVDGLVAPPSVEGEQEAEAQNLKSNVREKDGERPVKLSPEHRYANRHLQHRVGDPEDELSVGGHQPVFLPAGGATVDRLLKLDSPQL